MVRRGSGERGFDRAGDCGGIDWLRGERADRAPGGQHVGRAEPEHVLARHPDERPRAWAVVVGDQGGEPTHERDRQLPGLALDQVPGGGDLVRHRRHGDLEGVAERVLLAPVVAHRQHPGRADRRVGLAGPPRAAHGVRDHHADGHPEPPAQRLAQPPGGLVGILGEQHDRAGRGVGLVDPGRRHHQPVPGLRDRRRAAPGHHADGLGRDRVVAGHRRDPALGLADDLGRDHENVAVEQPGPARGERGVRDHLRQVVARGDLRYAGQPGNGDLRGHRASSPAKVDGGPCDGRRRRDVAHVQRERAHRDARPAPGRRPPPCPGRRPAIRR